MNFKYLVFDIETIPQENLSKAQLIQLEKKKKSTTMEDVTILSTDPFLGKVIVISIFYKNKFDNSEQCKAIYGTNEKEILEEFWNGITKLEHNTKLISFNGFNFDIPWLRIRSIINGIQIPNSKVNFFNLNPYKGCPHIDLMVVLKGDKYNRMISVGLDLACNSIGITSPKDGGIDGSQVYKAFKDGRLEEIAEYGKRDVIATGLLFEKLVELNYIEF